MGSWGWTESKKVYVGLVLKNRERTSIDLSTSQRRKNMKKQIGRMRRRISRFNFYEAVEDLIRSTSLIKRDSVSPSIIGRKEESEVKKKKMFLYWGKGWVWPLQEVALSSTTGCQGESAAPDFSEPHLHPLPPSSPCPRRQVLSSATVSLLLKATVADGNVPYFLGGMEQEKACNHWEVWSEGNVGVWRALTSEGIWQGHRTVFFKHVDHQTLLGPLIKVHSSALFPEESNSGSVQVGGVGLHNF